MKLRILLICLLPLMLLSQPKGGIHGYIYDSAGEPLPGVNVMVKGTYYGTASGLDGYFSITDMTRGSYDVEVSMIGYKVILRTGIIVIPPAMSDLLEFKMEETVLSAGEEVVVIGKKPLFDVDETASSIKMSADDFQNLVVNSVDDILVDQIGVTKVDNEIHIRGGRVDESMYIIDGLSVKDPLSGYSGNLYVNAEAIEELEVVTGGYSAEYGQAMSGVVNVKLKEGRDTYDGSIKYQSDNWGYFPENVELYTTDQFELNIGGPSLLFEKILPLLNLKVPGRVSFFANAYGKVYDSYLPSAEKLYPHRNWLPLPGMSEETADDIMAKLAPRENNDWHALYKLTWSLSPQKKLSASYDMSLNINQGYFMGRAFSGTSFPYRYMKILDNYNTITREARLMNLSWTHTLSTRSFYEVTFGHFTSLEHSAVQDLSWTEYLERLDLEPIEYIVTNEDGDIRINYGDEFYDTGFSSEWYDLSSNNYRIDADWTYHTLTRHKLKAGLENTYTTIQVIDIDEPWTGVTGLGKNYDLYQVKTDFGALYLQDRITFQGMTANVGVRYDYWIPGKYFTVDDLQVLNPDVPGGIETIESGWISIEEALLYSSTLEDSSGIFGASALQRYRDETVKLGNIRFKGRFSPRVGISHPVTDNDVLYFYYGHFSQLPTFQYVYSKLTSSSESTYQLFGNPNLNPKTTVQYELGIKHRFNDDQVLEVKAYWKDMFDYETSQTISHPNPRYSRVHFNMYFNADYTRARGIELLLKSRFWDYWYADVNFNYSIVTGKSSTPDDNFLVQAGELSEKILGETYMSWDKPFQFFANISYNSPSNWGASLRFDFESGRRYTRSIPDTAAYPGGIEVVDGVSYYRGTSESDKPYFYIAENAVNNTDIKLYKSFYTDQFEYRIYTEIENVFDQVIPRRINPFTGRGYDPGEIYSYSLISSPNPNYNPARNRSPRRIQLGVQFKF